MKISRRPVEGKTHLSERDIRIHKLEGMGIILCGPGKPTDEDLDIVEDFARWLTNSNPRTTAPVDSTVQSKEGA